MSLPRLVLLRHATALAEEVDPERPLSPEGVAEAESVAHGLAAYVGIASKYSPDASGAAPDVVIVHSGKLRTAQTAAIVRDVLVLGGCRLLGDGADGDALSPQADPALVIALMDEMVTPQQTLLVLVGHLPHLHVLSAALGVEADAAQFGPAGGLCLEKSDGWKMAAHIDMSSWWMEAPPPPPAPPVAPP